MKSNQKILKSLKTDENGFSWLVPLAMAVVVMFSLLIAGSYVIGTMGSQLEESFGTPATRTAIENETVEQMQTFTEGYGDVGNILKVVAIIAAVGMAILAIMGIASRRD